jgi:hypothetical protein
MCRINFWWKKERKKERKKKNNKKKGNAKRGVSPRLKIRPYDLDL